METSITRRRHSVMAGLVPAISSGSLPPPMAGTVAGHDALAAASRAL